MFSDKSKFDYSEWAYNGYDKRKKSLNFISMYENDYR